MYDIFDNSAKENLKSNNVQNFQSSQDNVISLAETKPIIKNQKSNDIFDLFSTPSQNNSIQKSIEVSVTPSNTSFDSSVIRKNHSDRFEIYYSSEKIKLNQNDFQISNPNLNENRSLSHSRFIIHQNPIKSESRSADNNGSQICDPFSKVSPF